MKTIIDNKYYLLFLLIDGEVSPGCDGHATITCITSSTRDTQTIIITHSSVPDHVRIIYKKNHQKSKITFCSLNFPNIYHFAQIWLDEWALIHLSQYKFKTKKHWTKFII